MNSWYLYAGFILAAFIIIVFITRRGNGKLKETASSLFEAIYSLCAFWPSGTTTVTDPATIIRFPHVGKAITLSGPFAKSVVHIIPLDKNKKMIESDIVSIKYGVCETHKKITSVKVSYETPKLVIALYENDDSTKATETLKVTCPTGDLIIYTKKTSGSPITAVLTPL